MYDISINYFNVYKYITLFKCCYIIFLPVFLEYRPGQVEMRDRILGRRAPLELNVHHCGIIRENDRTREQPPTEE